MNNTPRVEAAIGPPRNLGAHEFVALSAIYSDLLQLARQMEREVARMQAVLLKLDERGGLCDMHDEIRNALGTPNGHFCSRARQCLAARRCVRDPVCID